MDETAEFETLFPSLGLEETVNIPASATIGLRPPDLSGTIRDGLPLVSLDEASTQPSSSPAQFRVQKELGRGGMGIVQLAYQQALGREVAIKTVLPARRASDVEDALLQEARIMGLVEHPNVVPVHLIGRDDEERPVIVMKRVEGTSWEEFLAADDPAQVLREVSSSGLMGAAGTAGRVRQGDALEFHLDVLTKVTQALAFAHHRGVLHRDIKPANVMIGAFGEVYLLDWGLAVALPGHDLPMLPRALDADYVCGTPNYMAPEMTVGRGDQIGVPTDIYILGAILYEILTGAPPHAGRTLFEVMRSAYEGRRAPYPAGLPGEICAIAEKAMAREPAQRYPSAQAFLQAVEEFRHHRSSYVLTREASENLAALRASVGGVGRDVIDVYRSFGAARFGFEQALDIWPQNAAATRGLRDSLMAMIDFELVRGNHEAASALAADLPREAGESEAIEARIAEVRRQEAQRARELEVLRDVYHDFDASVGIRLKVWLIILLGASFAVLSVTTLVWRSQGQPWERMFYVIPPVTFFPVMLVITALGWKTFRVNTANRVLLSALWLMWGYGAIIRGATLVARLPYGPSIAFELLVFSLGAGILALTFYRQMIIPTTAFFIGAVVTLLQPQWGFEVFGFSSAAACFGFGVAMFLARLRD